MSESLKNKALGKYIRSQQNLSLALKKARMGNWIQLFFSFILLVTVVYLAINRPVYIIPYGLNKKTVFVNNKVTARYLTQLARDDASTYWNVTPLTIKGQNSFFLRRISPDRHGALQIALAKRTKNYKQNNKSSIFYPSNNASVDMQKYSVSLPGDLDVFIGNKKISSNAITMHIKYSINYGTAYIKGWKYDE